MHKLAVCLSSSRQNLKYPYIHWRKCPKNTIYSLVSNKLDHDRLANLPFTTIFDRDIMENNPTEKYPPNEDYENSKRYRFQQIAFSSAMDIEPLVHFLDYIFRIDPAVEMAGLLTA